MRHGTASVALSAAVALRNLATDPRLGANAASLCHQPQVLRFFGEQFNTTREQLVEHWQKLAAKMKIKAPAHSRLRASIAKATTSKVRSARLGFI